MFSYVVEHANYYGEGCQLPFLCTCLPWLVNSKNIHKKNMCNQLVELGDSKLHSLNLVPPCSYMFLANEAGGVGSQQEQHKWLHKHNLMM